MSATGKLVEEQVFQILDSTEFKNWLEETKPSKPGYVVFNNSFFFRESQKTTKSSGYLSVRFDPTKGGVLKKDIFILEGFRMNSDFQFFADTTAKIKKGTSLEDSLTDLIGRFGKVAFVFIGKIRDDVVLSEEVDDDVINKLTLNPKGKNTLTVADGELIINELLDDETLWAELKKDYKPDGKTPGEPPDILASPLAKALRELRAKAYVRLTLPDGANKDNNTLLDDIANAFEEANKAYNDSLSKCSGDFQKNQQEFNNILRLAYNFATDAVEFLQLIVHLSDLKPPVLFATIASQLKPSNSFKALPWPRSEEKGSLKLYDATIKGARNRAFHRLFPFSKAIDVDVTDISFKATKLRLFPEFIRKKESQLDYEDRGLVEIMTQFSRTPEHTVSPVFWQKNLAVMENTVALLKQLKAALFAILSDQKGNKA